MEHLLLRTGEWSFWFIQLFREIFILARSAQRRNRERGVLFDSSVWRPLKLETSLLRKDSKFNRIFLDVDRARLIG